MPKTSKKNSSDTTSAASSNSVLVIVESPAKAKTIAKYLGHGYIVESSVGHIRDLPKRAADIPERYKKEPWSRLGLDVENGFKPLYVVDDAKKDTVAKLKKLAKEVDEIILATDDDREGESIAWHLYQELKPKVPVRRMVFHEITKEAIQEAIASPREINGSLVEAQEARRALDRLYGYEVSPVLWRKVAPRLSAGRVQSVATRMLVQRERERMRFISAVWWDVLAFAQTQTQQTQQAQQAEQGQNDDTPDIRKHTFPTRLIKVNGQRLAVGKDFDPLTGKLKEDKQEALLLSETQTRRLAVALEQQALKVISAEEKPFTKRPPAPFITSTLQQEGSRKLGFAATRTMRAAQKLYESGYITYMRTDSTNLSTEAVQAARAQVQEMYGPDYLSPKPRIYTKKSKNAQEAHEAVRPAGSSFRTPASLKDVLGALSDEWKLYNLIWKRTVACQMADAKGRSLRVRLESGMLDLPELSKLPELADHSAGRSADESLPWTEPSEPSGATPEPPQEEANTFDTATCIFSASGSTIDFAGFLRAYVEGSDDPAAALETRDNPLPPLSEGQQVTVKETKAERHETQPPSRYTEASLVQALEAAGIGRPSTYASILGTIQSRGYALRRGPALVPTWMAFATSALLEHHFGTLVDYDFTARMEQDLDDIAGGRAHREPYLRRFYLGDNGEGMALKPLIQKQMSEIDARSIATIHVPRLVDSGIEVRVGRYGAYMQREEVKANLPEEMSPDELTLEKAEELLSQPQGDIPLGDDPKSGQPVFAKNGRFGPYVVLGEETPPEKTASLFPNDNLSEITLERALMLLSLPRLVGISEGEEIWAQNGKFGPYIKRGKDSRSLSTHEQIFGVTLSEAETIFKQPRFGKGRTAAPPLKTFTFEGRPDIVLKTGRFGPYLTDGERNATLRKGENEHTIEADRALEILEERGKVPKSKAKATTKKATAKKTTTKKTATKATKAAKTTKGAKKDAKKSAKPKLTWEQLKPHLDILEEVERQLIVEIRDKGRKTDEVAPELGLEPAKAKGMMLQVSKKLNKAARESQTV